MLGEDVTNEGGSVLVCWGKTSQMKAQSRLLRLCQLVRSLVRVLVRANEIRGASERRHTHIHSHTQAKSGKELQGERQTDTDSLLTLCLSPLHHKKGEGDRDREDARRQAARKE
jgi:hypothetical protein